MQSPLFAPVIALVLWSFVMWAWLYATRIPAIRKYKVVMDPHQPPSEFHAQLPAPVRWKADNYNNLMEQPTLFYAVVLTLARARRGQCAEPRARLALCGVARGAQPRAGNDEHDHRALFGVHDRVGRACSR